jgi:hypothetical protein
MQPREPGALARLGKQSKMDGQIAHVGLCLSPLHALCDGSSCPQAPHHTAARHPITLIVRWGCSVVACSRVAAAGAAGMHSSGCSAAVCSTLHGEIPCVDAGSCTSVLHWVLAVTWELQHAELGRWGCGVFATCIRGPAVCVRSSCACIKPAHSCTALCQ